MKFDYDEIETESTEYTGDLAQDPLADKSEEWLASGKNPMTPFGMFLSKRKKGKVRSKTLQAWERTMVQFVEYMEGTDRHAACPNEDSIRGFINHRLNVDDVEIGTVKSDVRRLNAWFRFMMDSYQFEAHTSEWNPIRNVFEEMDWEKEPPKPPHPIPLDTMREIVGGITNIRDRAIVGIQLKLGLRATEVCNIKLEDVALNHEDIRNHYEELGSSPYIEGRENVIFIPSKNERQGNKSARASLLPLDEELRSLLMWWLLIRPDADRPWLFLSKSNHSRLGDKDVNSVWREHFRPEYDETELYRAVTSHFGRHYFTNRMEQQGVRRELYKYMRGDNIKEDYEDGAFTEYIHTNYEDIEGPYGRNIYRLGLER